MKSRLVCVECSKIAYFKAWNDNELKILFAEGQHVNDDGEDFCPDHSLDLFAINNNKPLTEMTKDEIEEIVRAFAAAPVQKKKAMYYQLQQLRQLPDYKNFDLNHILNELEADLNAVDFSAFE